MRIYEGDYTLKNCTIYGNSAQFECGGVYISQQADYTLRNCIAWGNSDMSGTGESAQLVMYSSSGEVGYNCIQGWTGSLGGIGNIDADPCFVDPCDGDYHLRWNSGCVDAGDPCYAGDPCEVDIDGEPRVMGGRVDIGADEVGAKQGDFTRDGRIDGDDMRRFMEAWLSQQGDERWYVLCDLYPDGIINVKDFASLVRDWFWQASWYGQ